MTIPVAKVASEVDPVFEALERLRKQQMENDAAEMRLIRERKQKAENDKNEAQRAKEKAVLAKIESDERVALAKLEAQEDERWCRAYEKDGMSPLDAAKKVAFVRAEKARMRKEAQDRKDAEWWSNAGKVAVLAGIIGPVAMLAWSKL